MKGKIAINDCGEVEASALRVWLDEAEFIRDALTRAFKFDSCIKATIVPGFGRTHKIHLRLEGRDDTYRVTVELNYHDDHGAELWCARFRAGLHALTRALYT